MIPVGFVNSPCMVYKIVLYGNEILRKQCELVDEGADVRKLTDDMFETMYNAKGVGLAAPQVGLNMRLFVADLSSCKNDYGIEKLVPINPILEFPSDIEVVLESEGCLSIPDMYAYVPRKKAVIVKYHDVNWNYHEEKFSDMAARIIQHEADHLYGKMYIDHIIRTKSIEKHLDDIAKKKVTAKYEITY